MRASVTSETATDSDISIVSNCIYEDGTWLYFEEQPFGPTTAVETGQGV